MKFSFNPLNILTAAAPFLQGDPNHEHTQLAQTIVKAVATVSPTPAGGPSLTSADLLAENTRLRAQVEAQAQLIHLLVTANKAALGS